MDFVTNSSVEGLLEDDEIRYGIGEEWEQLSRPLFKFLANGFPVLSNPDYILEHTTITLLRDTVNEIARSVCWGCSHDRHESQRYHMDNGCMDPWFLKLARWLTNAVTMVSHVYGERYVLPDEPCFLALMRWELLRNE